MKIEIEIPGNELGWKNSHFVMEHLYNLYEIPHGEFKRTDIPLLVDFVGCISSDLIRLLERSPDIEMRERVKHSIISMWNGFNQDKYIETKQ